jgi:hypothetical protein
MPPAAITSWKLSPLSKLTSSTPPSNPSCVLKLLSKDTCICSPPETREIFGDKSRLSLVTSRSSTYAAFGGEANGGCGSPLLEVTHVVLDQPGGNAGGTTVSNCWIKSATRLQLRPSSSGLPWRLKTDVGIATETTAAETKEIEQKIINCDGADMRS